MQISRDPIAKIRFLVIAIFSIILVKIFLKFLSPQSFIKKLKNISMMISSPNESSIKIERIHLWYLKLNEVLRIKSCLVNCLSQKIVFSYFGFKFLVICGVRFDKESNFKGHAWLSYKDKIIFEDSKDIENYVESFKV